MRWKQVVLVLAALLTVGVLAACGGGESSGSDQAGSTNGQNEQKTPQGQTAPDEQVAPDQGGGGSENESAGAPDKKTLKLNVPNMTRIENSRVPSGKGSAENLFKNNAAVHLKGTDFPWESEAEDTNVYLAGHRLGYPGTPSHLAFSEIEELQNGDRVFLQDANNTKYTYKVFNTVVVEPTDLSVLEPVAGKDIVSLQSCTLPNYSDRVIVQAELTSTEKA